MFRVITLSSYPECSMILITGRLPLNRDYLSFSLVQPYYKCTARSVPKEGIMCNKGNIITVDNERAGGSEESFEINRRKIDVFDARTFLRTIIFLGQLSRHGHLLSSTMVHRRDTQKIYYVVE